MLPASKPHSLCRLVSPGGCKPCCQAGAAGEALAVAIASSAVPGTKRPASGCVEQLARPIAAGHSAWLSIGNPAPAPTLPAPPRISLELSAYTPVAAGTLWMPCREDAIACGYARRDTGSQVGVQAGGRTELLEAAVLPTRPFLESQGRTGRESAQLTGQRETRETGHGPLSSVQLRLSHSGVQSCTTPP